MKHNQLPKMLAAALLLIAVSSAQAGPGAQGMYRPIASAKQAQALKVGDQIAISCGNCGTITTLTVDKDRNNLKSYTCPTCQREFHYLAPGGGGRAAGQYSYVDKEGDITRLYAVKH